MKNPDREEDNTQGHDKVKSLLSAALEYAKAGFKVFPCEPRGKAPMGTVVPHGHRDATTSSKIIRSWWTQIPDANIGLVPQEGQAIIDVDPRNGGARLDLDTLTSKTGGGGFHQVLADAPHPLPGKLGKGLDLKANGKGYIIAPPSIHPNGVTYEWIGGFDPDRIAPWPKGLVAAERPPAGRTGSGDRLTPSQLDRLLMRISADEYDTWIAVGQAIKRDYPESFETWRAWSQESLFYGGAKECAAKWASFHGDGRGTGTLVYLAGGKVPRPEAHEEFSRVERDILDDTPSGRKQVKVRKNGTGAEEDGGHSQLVLISAKDVPIKPIDWLIPGYLARGMLHCIAGYGGEGKSNIASGIITAVSRQEDILTGRKLGGGRIKTLMITEEPLAYQTAPRFELSGADLDNIYFIHGVMHTSKKGKETVVSWNLSDHLAQVRELIQADPSYQVLVIDPIGSYMSGKKRMIDTWKDSDVRDVLGPWQRLAEELGICILYIAHFNKGKSNRPAEKVTGSSAFTTVTRMTYLAGRPDPEWLAEYAGYATPDRGSLRALLPIKWNIGREPPGILFSVESVGEHNAPRISVAGALPRELTANVLEQIMGPVGKASEVGRVMDRALDLIKAEPGLTQGVLSERLGVSTQNLGKELATLRDKGLVVYHKHKNEHWFYAADAGGELLE